MENVEELGSGVKIITNASQNTKESTDSSPSEPEPKIKKGSLHTLRQRALETFIEVNTRRLNENPDSSHITLRLEKLEKNNTENMRKLDEILDFLRQNKSK